MIEVRGLTKRYGAKIAVSNLSFDVEPGTVTGFLGPNGAGKTTTMRLILGLDYPAAVHRLGVEQRADLAHRVRQLTVRLAANGDRALEAVTRARSSAFSQHRFGTLA